VATGLSVPERTLLFSIACGVDWNHNPSSITRATVVATVLKGLVERDATGRLTLSGEGCAAGNRRPLRASNIEGTANRDRVGFCPFGDA
jgi:hypothetical protein